MERERRMTLGWLSSCNTGHVDEVDLREQRLRELLGGLTVECCQVQADEGQMRKVIRE